MRPGKPFLSLLLLTGYAPGFFFRDADRPLRGKLCEPLLVEGFLSHKVSRQREGRNESYSLPSNVELPLVALLAHAGEVRANELHHSRPTKILMALMIGEEP